MEIIAILTSMSARKLHSLDDGLLGGGPPAVKFPPPGGLLDQDFIVILLEAFKNGNFEVGFNPVEYIVLFYDF